jgi:hypothetical protein
LHEREQQCHHQLLIPLLKILPIRSSIGTLISFLSAAAAPDACELVKRLLGILDLDRHLLKFRYKRLAYFLGAVGILLTMRL